MSKRVQRQGRNWALDVELTDSLIFIVGVLLGMIIAKI